MEPLLKVRGLVTRFKTKKGDITAVDEVDFEIHRARILGVVGESGCGKSVTSLSILSLLSSGGEVAAGEVILEGRNLRLLSEKEMCGVRGNEIAMIFQDPMTSLNPVFTIEQQLVEPFMIHRHASRREAREKALEMLRKVGIPSPERRLNEYPHQLSGGMRQRVMIAMALSCNPKLLIADEPTTALDVTIQAQILDLMRELRDRTGTAIMLITHDMGVVAEMADDILVMYAGKAVEYGPAERIFASPKHPYTQGLLRSIPRLDEDTETLYAIKGAVPGSRDLPPGCRFAPRCSRAAERCRREPPPMGESGGVKVCCFFFEGGSRD
ncbi:MAG: ABC transporter ATP-binding protein [Treponema sp.]|jgi:oligopeptide/dipeptide ABC transporter ATP-binding protein|nr:ABC transporter ATP-binding protein [Treponema sp.]